MDPYCICLKRLTAIGSHAGNEVLGEVCHHLVDVFLWRLFPDGLQSDFQLISRLWLQLKFMASFGIAPQTSRLKSGDFSFWGQ